MNYFNFVILPLSFYFYFETIQSFCFRTKSYFHIKKSFLQTIFSSHDFLHVSLFLLCTGSFLPEYAFYSFFSNESLVLHLDIMIHKAVVSHTLSSWDTSQEPTQESFSFHSRCSSATWPIPYTGSGSGFLTSIFIGHLFLLVLDVLILISLLPPAITWHRLVVGALSPLLPMLAYKGTFI